MGKQNLEEPIPRMMMIPPEMLTKELRVATTAATDVLTPTAGKRIRVLGFGVSTTVLANLTSTLRSTLAFGTAHDGDDTKIMYSHRHINANNPLYVIMSGINVVGAIDEVVQLTNATFSVGECVSRAVVYYREE